ncbi:MAG: sulfotransferase domain-containing protein [Planctomycetaceae bacterium]|nr:sulfotransferase domain-containing protein [Planctomycetaceae bacterium]
MACANHNVLPADPEVNSRKLNIVRNVRVEPASPQRPALRQGIVWLASYPKSGNTWTRIFFRNLLSDRPESISLDEIGFGHAAERRLFDELAGIDSADLTPDEVDSLRPAVYEHMVEQATELPILMKAHDAYTYLPDGRPLLSRTATAGAILLIRNPLDVAVSYAHHGGQSDFDRTIELMSSRNELLNRTRCGLSNQLRQKMCGWSGFYESWKNAGVPMLVLRYEDMKADPQNCFTAATRFAGFAHSKAEIAAAIDRSRFENLQQQEREQGFRERMPDCQAFFRRGKVGTWREELSPQQPEQIICDHGDLMREFGYLSTDGSPAY